MHPFHDALVSFAERRDIMMIQDIYPHKLHNEYDNDIVPCKDDIVLCFDGENLLVKLDGKMIFPKVSDFEEGTEFTYLFKLDD